MNIKVRYVLSLLILLNIHNQQIACIDPFVFKGIVGYSAGFLTSSILIRHEIKNQLRLFQQAKNFDTLFRTTLAVSENFTDFQKNINLVFDMNTGKPKPDAQEIIQNLEKTAEGKQNFNDN